MSDEASMADKKQSVSKEVLLIASQASEIHSQQGCRWDTYFYKVVIGGNVRVTKEVVSYMEEQQMTDVLDWLWQRGPHEEVKHHHQAKSSKLLITKIIMCFWMMVISIILTPIFYIMHILSVSLLNRQQKRISANIQLPLAYAAFSQSKEMMQYFLSQGVDIENIDKRGNNVFHYVSDLSAESKDALGIFYSLVAFIDNADTVRKLLVVQRNSSGLTAIEYAAKFGCPTLLNHILKHPNVLQETPFLVNPETVCIDGDSKRTLSSSAEPTAKLELVDVTIYEAGSITQQSTLLNLLSDRDVSKIMAVNLKMFHGREVIGKWMDLKIKQMIPGTVGFHTMDSIITLCLVLIVSTTFLGENGISYLKWKNQQLCQVQENEIDSLANNQSSIFKPDSFRKIHSISMHFAHLYNIMQWQEENSPIMEVLLNTSMSAKLQNMSLADMHSMHPRYFMSQSELDQLFAEALQMKVSDEHLTTLYVFSNYSTVVQQFAARVHDESKIFEGGHCLHSRHARHFYENFTIGYKDKVIKPSKVLDYADLYYNFICLTSLNLNRWGKEWQFYDFQDLRLKKDDDISAAEEVYGKTAYSCEYKMVMTAMKKGCSNIPISTVARYYSAIHVTDKDLQTFVRVCTYTYIVIDILERCLFIAISVAKQTTKRDMLVTVLGTKLPGSYARKQFNLLSYFCILIGDIIYQYANDLNYWKAIDQYYIMMNIVTILFILAVIIRFLMHIHSMRLMPGIGHFVITTFMMATNLLHFSTVFGMVLLIFSGLFHILIDDPNCPLQKSQGFVTFYDSFFSTFKLAFGHLDVDESFSTIPVQLTYFLYVVIVGLLLLNLIIAIMSSTATDIMADPWKEALWNIEWLDEATSVEYSCSAVQLAMRKCTNWGYAMHKKAGYMVKNTKGSSPKVYIEIFQCQGTN